MTSRYLAFAAAAVLGMASLPASGAAQEGAQVADFVPVRLPEGVSLDLPSNFRLLDQEGRELRTLYGAAALDLSGIPRGPGNVLLSAKSPSSRSGWAEIIVSVQRGAGATQADVAGLTGAQLRQIDQQMRADIEASQQVTGAKILEWRGSQKIQLGSTWSLVAKYKYIMPGDETPREMESHRVFLGDRNIGILLQYSEANGEVWRVLLARVQRSLRVAP